MLRDYLAHHIRVEERIDNWRDAIRCAAQPLLEDACITGKYVTAMIESVEQHGFYVVISEGVAMPHARPECGALKVGLSLLKINQPVLFGDRPVDLVFVLSATDKNSHIDVLVELAEMLENEALVTKLRKADGPEAISDLLAVSVDGGDGNHNNQESMLGGS